jgi:hypothetical protein
MDNEQDLQEKSAEQHLREKFRGIGCGAGKPLEPATIQCDFYAEFMRRRFPEKANREDGIDPYALEWAGRFRDGTMFHYGDGQSQAILLDIMVDGTDPYNAPHISKEMLQKWYKGRKW